MTADPNCEVCQGRGWRIGSSFEKADPVVERCDQCLVFDSDDGAALYLISQAKACRDITDILTAVEWDSSTVSAVADILRAAGHTIDDPVDTYEDEEVPQ